MSRIKNTNLTIMNDSNDLSFNLSSFKGTSEITVSDSKYLYIGYRKPIHTFYIDWNSKTSVSGNLIVEKYNGSDWDSVDFQDDTNVFSNSGFIFTDEKEDEAKTTINSKELYWFRISTDSATDSVVSLRYINLIFNDLKDLLALDSNIEKLFPQDFDDEDSDTYGDTIKSIVLWAIASRNQILKDINTSGRRKYNGTDVRLINQFDLFDINEVRRASADYCMHVAYRNLVDNSDTNYKELSDDYLASYKQNLNLFSDMLLTIDTDDDGEVDSSEKTNSTLKTYRITR